MSIGDDLQGDVAQALIEFGRAVTLRKIVPGAYNEADGSTAAATTTDHATTGLLLAYSDRVVDGELIKQNDRRCILKVQGLSVAPEINDRVVVGSDVYTVISFKTVEIGGVVVLYTLQVRR